MCGSIYIEHRETRKSLRLANCCVLLMIQLKKGIKMLICSMTQTACSRDQEPQETCWRLYLQIILPQVFVFLAIFVLIEDGGDFRPLWF